MSGSMTYRAYTSNSGEVYTLKVDESNANAIATNGAGLTSGVLLPVRIANSPYPPCGLKPRYVNTRNSANPLQKRRFVYSTAVAAVVLSAGATISAPDYPPAGGAGAGVLQTWVVTSDGGEKSRRPPSFSAFDSGLDDGTVSQ